MRARCRLAHYQQHCEDGYRKERFRHGLPLDAVMKVRTQRE